MSRATRLLIQETAWPSALNTPVDVSPTALADDDHNLALAGLVLGQLTVSDDE